MIDRETVIKGLECCLGSNDCDVEPKEDCPYKGMCLCAMALHLDILTLLKEQDAVADDIKKAIDYLDWHFEADDGTSDKDAQKAWCIIKNKLVE